MAPDGDDGPKSTVTGDELLAAPVRIGHDRELAMTDERGGRIRRCPGVVANYPALAATRVTFTPAAVAGSMPARAPLGSGAPTRVLECAPG